MPVLPFLVTLLFSFLSLLFSELSSFIALRLPLKLGLFALPLFSPPFFFGNPPLLLLNRSFLLPELFSEALALGLSRLGVGGVLLVRFGPAHPLGLGSLVADVGAADLANACLDGAVVDQLPNDLFRFLVDAGPLQGTVDERRGLASVQGEKLPGVSLHFLLGDLEDGLRHLSFVVLVVDD